MKQLLFVMLLIGAVAYAGPWSYVGKHISVLIADWGAPTRITPDGLGGKIYVYVEGEVYESEDQPEYDYNTGRFVNRGTKSIVDTRETYEFYVNKKGIIYKWR